MTAVLRESSEAAARERLRLEAAAGRSRVAAAINQLPMKLRYLGSEQAARSGLRYQPVAWTVIAVAAVAFFFPGRPDPVAEPAPVALPRPAAAATSPTTTPVAPATPAAPSLPSSGFTPPAASFSPSTPASPTFTPSGPPPPSSSSSSSDTPMPLTVAGWGWASSLSGSPVSSAGVPEDTLPVATRLGQVDKVSFVRLSGTDTALRLTEDTEGAREAMGSGAVVACPITEPGWAEEPDQSLDEAPAWDAESCVVAVEDADTWTFDLSGFQDRESAAGFALVPDASAPPDFQVTFSVV